jgi:hypothetical protein
LGRVGTYAGAAFLGYQGIHSLAKSGGQGIAAGIGEIAGAAGYGRRWIGKPSPFYKGSRNQGMREELL